MAIERPATIDTASYWESRYRSGGTSGAGSYGHLALYKAKFLNRFVAVNGIRTVAEFGSGDGEQLRRAVYPNYAGYDVSQSAVETCRQKFQGDANKEFFLLGEVKTFNEAELVLSLDVVYHLLEDRVFEHYINCLFRTARRYVIIYGNGCVRPYEAQHVRLRNYHKFIAENKPDWNLVNAERNPHYSEVGTNPASTWSNFYVYETSSRSRHPYLRRCVLETTTSNSRGPADTAAPKRLPEQLQAILPKCRRVVAVNPRTVELLSSVHHLRAGLDVTGAFVGVGTNAALAAIGAREQPWLTTCLNETLAQLCASPIFTQADIVLLEADIGADDLTYLVKSARPLTLFAKPQTLSDTQNAASEAVARGYASELLPELLGLTPQFEPSYWIGCRAAAPELIVSLTAISSRLVTLPKVLNSILSQSKTPDRVVLNISTEPYLRDAGVDAAALPSELVFWEQAGLLEINYVPNTGPYRKLLPTLKRYASSNCVIATADDDTIYPHHWLSEMYAAYLRAGSVIAYRCSQMVLQGGKPIPYAEWTKPNGNDEVDNEFKALFTFPTGKDGILYHPAHFTNDIFDPELVRIAPTCDDLVFKLGTMMTATPVVVVPRKQEGVGMCAEFPTVETGSGAGLWAINQQGLNDECLLKLIGYMRERGMLDITRFLRPLADL